MIVESNQIFNLMDTNGRRSDVLNALKIYLEILEELKEVYCYLTSRIRIFDTQNTKSE